MSSLANRGVAAGVAAAATTVVARAVAAAPPGGAELWTRRNYRDREVSLAAGPAVAAGALVGLLADPSPRSPVAAAGVAVGAAAAFGLYDDLTGSTHARGFRGHLAALRRGEVTTGLVKLTGIGVAGIVAAVAGGRRTLSDVVLDGGVIAGTANLVNLLDLRPGRALKSVLLVASPVALARGDGAGVGAVAVGAAAAALPGDLRERAMLGDAGANALGAAVGVGLVSGRSRAVRVWALLGLVALTAASERVSFSAVIDRTPALAALDRAGRRPAPGT